MRTCRDLVQHARLANTALAIALLGLGAGACQEGRDAPEPAATAPVTGGADAPAAPLPDAPAASPSIVRRRLPTTPPTEWHTEAPVVDNSAPPSGGAGATSPVPVPSDDNGVTWATTLDGHSYPSVLERGPHAELFLLTGAASGTVPADDLPLSMVVELSPEGVLAGERQLALAWGAAMAVGADDTVLLAGQTAGNTRFPNGDWSGNVHSEALVAKLDDYGVPSWVQRFGDDPEPFGLDQSACAVARAPDGGSVFAGSFAGQFVLGDQLLTSAGGLDVFVAKLDSTGRPMWSVRMGGSGDETGCGLALDAEGAPVLVGNFDAPTNLGDYELMHAGESDLFAVKLAAVDGKLLWSRRYGNALDQLGGRLRIDTDGSLVIALMSEGEPVLLDGGDLPTSGVPSAYVVRLSATGEPITSATLGDVVLGGFTLDDAGHIFVTGRQNVPVPPDRLIPNGAQIWSRVYVAELAATLAPVWETTFGDGPMHGGAAITVGADGAPIVAGSFGEAFSVGGHTLPTPSYAPSTFVLQLVRPAAP